MTGKTCRTCACVIEAWALRRDACYTCAHREAGWIEYCMRLVECFVFQRLVAKAKKQLLDAALKNDMAKAIVVLQMTDRSILDRVAGVHIRATSLEMDKLFRDYNIK